MQADRRVLARHSKDFLEGKKSVEKDKAALELQLQELEASRASLQKEHKDQARFAATLGMLLHENMVS